MAAPVSLVKALADALKRRATGAIASGGKGVARKVWIREGQALWVDSADPKERYTAILLRHGAITAPQILIIEQEFGGEGITEEEAVRAADTIPAADLDDLGRKVFEERLLTAFEAPGVSWALQPGGIAAKTSEYPMPLVLAILRGIRERYTLERLKLELPVSPDDHYTFAPEVPKKLGFKLSKVEETLARALDGKRDWSTVLGSTKLSPKDAHAALFAMSTLGVVLYAGDAAPAPHLPAAVARAVVGRKGEMRELAARPLAELLGVAPTAAVPAVQAGFDALVARYDLGHAHQLPEGDREAALALLDRAVDACLVLSHPQARPKYVAAAAADREAVAVGLALDLAAEKHFIKAGIFLQAGNFLAAEAAMLPALQLVPRDGRFHLRMGVAIYQRAKSRGAATVPAGAGRALEKAAAFDPKSSDPWLYLGHIAMVAGEKPKAAAYYRKALEINPGSNEARTAVARAGG